MPTLDLEEDIDTTILRSLEFDNEVPCESVAHPLGYLGHRLEDVAAVYILRKCCGVVTAMCEGGMAYVRTVAAEDGLMMCGVCKCLCPATEWKEIGPV